MIPDKLLQSLLQPAPNVAVTWKKEQVFITGHLTEKFTVWIVVKFLTRSFFHQLQMKKYIPEPVILTAVNSEKRHRLFFNR